MATNRRTERAYRYDVNVFGLKLDVWRTHVMAWMIMAPTQDRLNMSRLIIMQSGIMILECVFERLINNLSATSDH